MQLNLSLRTNTVSEHYSAKLGRPGAKSGAFLKQTLYSVFGELERVRYRRAVNDDANCWYAVVTLVCFVKQACLPQPASCLTKVPALKVTLVFFPELEPIFGCRRWKVVCVTYLFCFML